MGFSRSDRRREKESVSKTRSMLSGNIPLEELDRHLKAIRPAPKLPAYLMNLLAERDLSCEDFGMLANIGRSTIYKILNGKQKPEQDMLLRMAFVLELSAEETQQLLKTGRRAPLTSSQPRDVAVIIGLQNGLTLDEMDCILMERGLPPLTPVEKKLSDFLAPMMKERSFAALLEQAHLDSSALAGAMRLSPKGLCLESLDDFTDDLEKDDLLRIGFALSMEYADIQRLLRIAHRAFLSVSDARDRMIIDGLCDHLTLSDMNACLSAGGFLPLI